MRNHVSIIFLLGIIIISCQKPENKKISINNITEDIETLNKEDLSGIETAFLTLLSLLENKPAAKLMAENLIKEGYSYSQAFDTIEKYKDKAHQLKIERTKLFSIIADTCSLVHKQAIGQKELRDSLNSLVYPKINIARKTTWDYYLAAIELDCTIRNRTGKTIRYLSFDFLLMKNDTLFARIPCELYNPVQESLQHDFIFDDKKNSRIYQLLESYGLPFYRAGYQVKKIVFRPNDTLAIDMRFYKDTLVFEPKTYTAELYSGQCPYLRNTDSLMEQKLLLKNKMNVFFEMSPSAFRPFWEWYFFEMD